MKELIFLGVGIVIGIVISSGKAEAAAVKRELDRLKKSS